MIEINQNSFLLADYTTLKQVTFGCLEDDEYLRIPINVGGYIPTRAELLQIVDEIEIFVKLTNDKEIERHNKEMGDYNKKINKYIESKDSRNKNSKYTKGLVYLLKSKEDNIYKIGVTTNINKRLPQIATKLPFEIKLEHKIEHNAIYKLEKFLHEKFDEKRLNGEWFRLSDNDVKYIKEEAKNEEVV